MGMYDIIVFSCPFCGAQIEEQTKADLCELRRYYLGNIPPAAAGSLHNQTGWCSVCERKYKIIVQCVVSIQLIQ